MTEKIVDKIVEKQIEGQQINAEEISIYRYGYILLIEVIINISIAIAIGIIFESIIMVLYFLGIYIPLRSYCGGWHADKIWKCTIISNIILLLEMLILKYMEPFILIKVVLICFPVLAIMILCLAPMGTQAKKISESEKEKYKKRIREIVAVHIVLVVVMMRTELLKFVIITVYSYFIQVVMLIMEKVKQKEK